MNIKKALKKVSWLKVVYRKVQIFVYSCATLISPTLNTRMRYRAIFGRKLNLTNPQTFNEKLLWLKLNQYICNPIVIQCADKYRVRDYVKDCGCEGILNALIGAWDEPDDIPWEELPNKFVLKWNFGAGMNIVCSDKSKMDKEDVLAQLRNWKKNKCWLPYSEMQYKYTPKKLICETYLEEKDKTGVIPDYKVYCFHGEPEAILVMHERGGDMKTEFFDREWNALRNAEKYETVAKTTDCPKCFDLMMEVSKKLSKPFPFVRCDYYVVNGELIFGEMTFTPAAGLFVSQTKINGKDMTEFLHVK